MIPDLECNLNFEKEVMDWWRHSDYHESSKVSTYYDTNNKSYRVDARYNGSTSGVNVGLADIFNIESNLDMKVFVDKTMRTLFNTMDLML